MAWLRWLSSAQADLIDILEFISLKTGDVEPGLRFVTELRTRCAELSVLPAQMGRPRPELRPDIRSFVFKGYVIFFRYRDDAFEVVNIVHGHGDIDAFFDDVGNG